jgi:hypothetical protein
MGCLSSSKEGYKLGVVSTGHQDKRATCAVWSCSARPHLQSYGCVMVTPPPWWECGTCPVGLVLSLIP